MNRAGTVAKQSLLRRRAVLGAALLLVCVTVAGYWRVGSADFVFDDERYIGGNPGLQRGLTLEGIRWALTSFHAANWHPVTWVSHLLDLRLFGFDPRGPHLVNLLLHAANALLLFSALRALTGAFWRSATVAALFAVHPLRVEAVAWISQRKDLLSLFFCLAALRIYSSHVRRPRAGTAASLTVLFALGLMSKPIIVTFPLLLLLLDRWPLRRHRGARLGIEKLPLFLLTFGSCLITWRAQSLAGSAVSLEDLPLDLRLGNAALSTLRYLGKTLWPRDLAVYYPLSGPGSAPWLVSGALLLLLAGISLLCIRPAGRRPYLLVGWLWYLGTLVPVIGLVQVGAQAMADRYMSLPLVGIAVAVVWGLGDVAGSRPRWGPLLAATGGAIIGLLTALTAVQVGSWRDCETLFTRALQVTKENWMMHLNLGNCLADKGRTVDAAREYAAAVRIRPRLAPAHHNYALALAALGRNAEAFTHYRLALSLEPDYAEALLGLGLLLAGQGNAEEAAALYRRAVKSHPDRPDAHLFLAELLGREGRWSEAIPHYREAVRLRPDSADAHVGLGAALEALGTPAAARAAYREAARIKPDHGDARRAVERLTRFPGRVPKDPGGGRPHENGPLPGARKPEE